MENFSENNTDFNETMCDDTYGSFETSSSSSREFPNVFALFARSLGIFSIFCAFFNIFFGTFICGGLAIILAILSKGYETKMIKNARIGFITGIAAISLQMFLFVFNIYNIINVPEYREYFNTIYEQIYGEPTSDSINNFLDELKISDETGGNL